MKYLEFEELSPLAYVVKVKDGGKRLGHLITENNGTFLFQPPPTYSAWQSYVLREIADKIDELDTPF